MTKIWYWIKCWFVGAGVDREVSALRSQLSALEKQGQEVIRSLEIGEARLLAIRETIRQESDKIERDIGSHKSYMQSQEFALEAVRGKLKICEDIIIPTLVAKHKTITEMSKAEMAVHVRQQVFTTPSQSE